MWSCAKLRRYISFAQKTIDPTVSEEAERVIDQYY